MALGAAHNPEYAYDAAHITGTELRAMGINQDNAPDTDVNVNPANPVIGVRSFGSHPDLVAALGSAAVQGYQDAGVAVTAKHFPDMAIQMRTVTQDCRSSHTRWIN